MTTRARATKRRALTSKAGRWLHVGQAGEVTSAGRVVERLSPASVDAVEDALRARLLGELAERQTLRAIYELADEHTPQRDIAALIGISQPEVSRRLKRRELRPAKRDLREIVIERQVGLISKRQMLERIRQLDRTTTVPRDDAALDGAATISGFARDLMSAYRSGLLTRDEYESVRSATP